MERVKQAEEAEGVTLLHIIQRVSLCHSQINETWLISSRWQGLVEARERGQIVQRSALGTCARAALIPTSNNQRLDFCNNAGFLGQALPRGLGFGTCWTCASIRHVLL